MISLWSTKNTNTQDIELPWPDRYSYLCWKQTLLFNEKMNKTTETNRSTASSMWSFGQKLATSKAAPKAVEGSRKCTLRETPQDTFWKDVQRKYKKKHGFTMGKPWFYHSETKMVLAWFQSPAYRVCFGWFWKSSVEDDGIMVFGIERTILGKWMKMDDFVFVACICQCVSIDTGPTSFRRHWAVSRKPKSNAARPDWTAEWYVTNQVSEITNIHKPFF